MVTGRAFVTGGAGGIGFAIAKHLVELGWTVGVCDRSIEALRAATGSVPSLYCANADASDAEQMQVAITGFTDMAGGLDCLVSNVGVSGPTAPLQDIEVDAWKSVMAVNVDSHFLSARATIPFLLKSVNASMIFMSSAAGRGGFPQRSSYCTSKWALHGLAKTLSDELSRSGIRSNVILPGVVDNERMRDVVAARAELTGQSQEAVWQNVLAITAFNEPVPMQEIAHAAAFLASPQARFITGQLIGIGENF